MLFRSQNLLIGRPRSLSKSPFTHASIQRIIRHSHLSLRHTATIASERKSSTHYHIFTLTHYHINTLSQASLRLLVSSFLFLWNNDKALQSVFMAVLTIRPIIWLCTECCNWQGDNTCIKFSVSSRTTQVMFCSIGLMTWPTSAILRSSLRMADRWASDSWLVRCSVDVVATSATVTGDRPPPTCAAHINSNHWCAHLFLDNASL